MLNPKAILNADNTAIKSITYEDGNHTIELSINDLKELYNVVFRYEEHLRDQNALKKLATKDRQKILVFPGATHPFDKGPQVSKPMSLPESVEPPNYQKLLSNFFEELKVEVPNDLTVIMRKDMGNNVDKFNIFTFYSAGGNDDKVMMALEQGKLCVLQKSTIA